MVERFIAPVLKTGMPKGIGGSNPPPSSMSNEYESTIRDMQKSINDYEIQIKTWMKAAEKFSNDAAFAKIENERYRSIFKDIEKAVNDAGLVPKYHHHVMKKHRDEWPTLWKAIDRLLNNA